MKIVFLFFVLFCFSCSSSAPSTPTSIITRGRSVYLANCVVCHNADPSKDGSVGPAIKNSSQELLKTRVLQGTYPAGYKPKRNSRLMPAFPQLKDDIQALAAFLSNP